jgi:hypothetical protein
MLHLWTKIVTLFETAALSVNELTRIWDEFWSLESDTKKYMNLTTLYHDRGYMELIKREIL